MDCQSSALKQLWGQRRSETFSKCGVVASHHHAAVAIPNFARILSLTFGLSAVAMVPAQRSLFPCVVVRGVLGGNGPPADAGLRCRGVQIIGPGRCQCCFGSGRAEGKGLRLMLLLLLLLLLLLVVFFLGGSAGGLVDQPDGMERQEQNHCYLSLFCSADIQILRLEARS